jgi:hypothetical protein
LSPECSYVDKEDKSSKLEVKVKGEDEVKVEESDLIEIGLGKKRGRTNLV